MNAAEFLDRAAPLLLADEARHNLILGVAATVRDHPARYPEARFWLVDGAAAMRTPPHNLILAKPRDEAALGALVVTIDDELPGVTAAQPELDAFVELWGRPAQTQLRSWIYALDAVVATPPAAGALREASRDDLDLLVDWWEAFAAEAAPHDRGDRDEYRRIVEHKLTAAGDGIAVWEDGGAVVSLAGYGSPTPNGVRIGPVYTPPELRGRGYATTLTAQVSQRLLDAGRRFCFLYTDAANPTSNAIYERIGYRRVCEAAMVAFA